MGQIEEARKGSITPEVRAVAAAERVDPAVVAGRVAAGRVVIPKNAVRNGVRVCGIGEGLRTKVNANIGTSAEASNVELELRKVGAAEAAGADAIMDLSTGGDIEAIRKRVIASTALPVGTVPIYQAAVGAARLKEGVRSMTVDEIFGAIEDHARDGVDFVTLHCGVTLEALKRLEKQGRVLDIVSRGGAFLAVWMVANGRENPLYEDYGRVLEICRRYDCTISLGDGLRPGCLADATDRAQIEELITLGELASAALDEGVQSMIEGPGHVPLHQIEENIRIQKDICRGAPFYVLGPIVTDSAPGYDHITSAIGGAIAASCGADFLCYVTGSEHLRLPDERDVREGVIVTRIAAHAADIAKGISGAGERDLRISMARKRGDFEEQMRLAIDPEKARTIRESSPPSAGDICTMCGEYCSIKLLREKLGGVRPSPGAPPPVRRSAP